MQRLSFKASGMLSKCVFLIGIYLLHALFFNQVMAVSEDHVHTDFLQFFFTHQTPKNQHSSTSDFRMLLKHESEKQALLNDIHSPAPQPLPDFVPQHLRAVSASICSFPFLRLADYSFRRYNILQVFLI